MGCYRQENYMGVREQQEELVQWIAGRQRVQNVRKVVSVLLSGLILAACGSPEPAKSKTAVFNPAKPAPAVVARAATETLRTRLALLDRAVTRWQKAPTLRVGHEAAEEARNLIVGANGPFYGDATGDGKISGAKSMGVLPGLKGEPGLADPNENGCVIADVLGGRWSDPAMRWSQLERAIAGWRPTKNTFPSLPSHPQRVVGWASLTLKSDRLANAREYAGHARLHVDISLRALDNCRR
jgi:hypothetical protein